MSTLPQSMSTPPASIHTFQVLAVLPPLPTGDEAAASSGGHIMDGPRLHKLEALLNAFDRYARRISAYEREWNEKQEVA